MHSSRMRTVLPLQWPSAGGGGVLPRVGVSAGGGGVLPSVWCTPPGGVCLLPPRRRAGLPRGGCLPGRGVCLLPGVHPSVDRPTDTCENITFPQLLLRTVIN